MRENFCVDCGKRISKGHKRCKSCAQKGSLNVCYGRHGKDHPFHGKHHSEEHKKKMSVKKKYKKRPELIGDKNPNWKNGATRFLAIVRGMVEYKIWRAEILLRDRYTCQICTSTKKVETHHKKPLSALVSEYLEKWKQYADDRNILINHCAEHSHFWDLNNGITLCQECHNKHKARK